MLPRRSALAVGLLFVAFAAVPSQLAAHNSGQEGDITVFTLAAEGILHA